jgi:hypothetical protein
VLENHVVEISLTWHCLICQPTEMKLLCCFFLVCNPPPSTRKKKPNLYVLFFVFFRIIVNNNNNMVAPVISQEVKDHKCNSLSFSSLSV